MKKNDHLMLLILIITIVFGIGYTSRASTPSDKLIKQRIQSDAADKIRLRETKVDLAVEDGYVVLFGTVDLYIQKMLYEQIAWKTEGVIEVDNEIRVTPGLPQTDAVIERKIMKVVRTYDRLKGLTITVAVKTGVVNIRITLNHPSDVLFLKRKVAEIDGVISINIQAKFFAYLPVFTNRCYVSGFLPPTPGTIQNIHFA
jgi:osmotically-inducible protein OsmY